MNPIMVVFHKEIKDAVRDRRSLFSAFMFCWLGPLIVGALWRQQSVLALLPGFLMISAFTGAMNIAIDTMAGERERGSLEALLMNPVTVRDLVLGKWLATSAFSAACIVLTLAGTLAMLFATPLGNRMPASALLWMFAAALPLAPLAAGVELLICTFARTPKEGTSYLSVTLLAPMLTGMFAEFYPVRLQAFVAAMPLLGQQRMLSAIARGEAPHADWLLLSASTAALVTAACIAATIRLLKSEKVVFGW